MSLTNPFETRAVVRLSSLANSDWPSRQVSEHTFLAGSSAFPQTATRGLSPKEGLEPVGCLHLVCHLVHDMLPDLVDQLLPNGGHDLGDGRRESFLVLFERFFGVAIDSIELAAQGLEGPAGA